MFGLLYGFPPRRRWMSCMSCTEEREGRGDALASVHHFVRDWRIYFCVLLLSHVGLNRVRRSADPKKIAYPEPGSSTLCHSANLQRAEVPHVQLVLFLGDCTRPTSARVTIRAWPLSVCCARRALLSSLIPCNTFLISPLFTRSAFGFFLSFRFLHSDPFIPVSFECAPLDASSMLTPRTVSQYISLDSALCRSILCCIISLDPTLSHVFLIPSIRS